jgi:hypothetical protein
MPKTNQVYLNAAQAKMTADLVRDHSEHLGVRADGLLVVLHQEEMLGGREGVRGWVMVELIGGHGQRELVTLDRDGNRRTVEETQAAIEKAERGD